MTLDLAMRGNSQIGVLLQEKKKKINEKGEKFSFYLKFNIFIGDASLVISAVLRWTLSRN